MKLLPDNIAPQLSLPFTSPYHEPAVADAGVTPSRRPDTRKLPSEYTDAELLTTVLGPSTAPFCEQLTTNHDGFRAIGFLSPAELIEHGFTTGAVHRLSAVFEIAKRYGQPSGRPASRSAALATCAPTSESTWPRRRASTSTRCSSIIRTPGSVT